MASSSVMGKIDKSMKCSAASCNNQPESNSSVFYFKFPRERDRCKTWLINCGRSDLETIFQTDPLYPHRSCCLCSDHFNNQQFTNVKQRTRLKAKAIPTIFDIVHTKFAVSESRINVEQVPQVGNYISDEDFNLCDGSIDSYNVEDESLQSPSNDVSVTLKWKDVLASASGINGQSHPNTVNTAYNKTNITPSSGRKTELDRSQTSIELSSMFAALQPDRLESIQSTCVQLVSMAIGCSAEQFVERVTMLQQLCEIWSVGDDVELRHNKPLPTDQQPAPADRPLAAILSVEDLKLLINNNSQSPVYIKLEFSDKHKLTDSQPKLNKFSATTYKPSVYPRRRQGDPVVLFPCPTCSRSFRYHSQLLQHQRHHDGVRPFACSTCGRRFALECSRDKHMTMHRPTDRPLMCDRCGRRFTHVNYLKSHQRTHDDARRDRPYACQECDRRFYYATSLRQHVFLRHTEATETVTPQGGITMAMTSPDVAAGIYTCHRCARSFSTIGHIRLHLRTDCMPSQVAGEATQQQQKIITSPVISQNSAPVVMDPDTTEEKSNEILLHYADEDGGSLSGGRTEQFCLSHLADGANQSVTDGCLVELTCPTQLACPTGALQFVDVASLYEHAAQQHCYVSTTTTDKCNIAMATGASMAMVVDSPVAVASEASIAMVSMGNIVYVGQHDVDIGFS